jgi:hypothetical protein
VEHFQEKAKSRDKLKADRAEARLKAAQAQYTDINERLKHDIPVFVSGAVEFMQPMVEVLLRGEVECLENEERSISVAIRSPFGEPACDMDFEKSLRYTFATRVCLSTVTLTLALSESMAAFEKLSIVSGSTRK